MPQHRHCILWYGSRFPSSNSQSTEECASLLEDLRRVSSNSSLNARDRYCHATGYTIRVREHLFCSHSASYSSLIFRGVRPYGVSLLVAGWDTHRGPSLYQVDPAGSFWAWKASAIGKNMVNAKTFLEKRYVVTRSYMYHSLILFKVQ